jgi:phosphatidylglycerophosphate synthase
MKDLVTDSTTLVIVGGTQSDIAGFTPALSRVATLPAALRIVLSAQSLKVNRTVMCVQSLSAPKIERELRRTGRSPKTLEWYEYFDKFDLGSFIREVGITGNVILVRGDRSYQPSLLRKAVEWKKSDGALTFTTDSELAGVCVLSLSAALKLAQNSKHAIGSVEDLHRWAESHTQVEVEIIENCSFQQISSPADLPKAEAKLNKWLVKPTDGLFARMNRRVSIPISRSLLRWPITPNMVTLFTLWVSFVAGLFFAWGGYWATLVGAVLSVWASILDGCDGEVARLKLQVTDFGCWLETVCDYLYYVFIFGGMIIGFTRTMGPRFALTWGPLLLVGAIASFLSVGFARHHFSGDRPEAFLSVWQNNAQQRKANPLLYVGRHCEFIIRRCFLPYAFLFFALFNILPYAFVATAIGANIVWCIALYSCFTMSRRRRVKRTLLAAEPRSTPATV